MARRTLMAWQAPMIVALLVAGCGTDTGEPDTSSVEPGPQPQLESSAPATAPDRPLTVFDTEGPLAIRPVMEAWRAEGGARFAIAESDYSTPFPEETDVLVAGSMAKLWAFAEEDKLRPVFSPDIEGRINDSFRDPESRWVGLSYRARVVAYNAALVSDEDLESIESYASLGDERWRERLCLSSSRVDGNRLLVAWLIRRHGEREAELIVRRWRANLPNGFVEANDEAVFAKISAGECAIGLVDSDRLAAAQNSSNVLPFWFGEPGATLIDISGAGVSRHATNPDAARALIEWLSTAGASAFFAASRTEFPANAEAATSNVIAEWASNVRVTSAIAELGFLLQQAELLAERAGYP